MATINTTDPKPGFVYDTETDTWFPLAGIAVQSLDGLTDVVITSAATNQVLAYNGTNWVNSAEAGDIASVTAGTGLSGGGSTGALTLSIDTSVTADLTTAQTLTNKTLTAPKISLSYTAKTDNYTIVDGDQNALFTMNAATAKTFSIPTDATFNFAIGTQVHFAWITGAGQPSIAASSSGTTTVLSTGATSTAPKLRVANSAATAIKLAANSWLVVGDIA
jgi:hypothetical protein